LGCKRLYAPFNVRVNPSLVSDVKILFQNYSYFQEELLKCVLARLLALFKMDLNHEETVEI
jgi:hypothetical protein